jgi:DNA primase
MAKISPVSIKYMIHATFVAEGALEKPDVIGALFGQTEGLLGADLEMRDLQKEGKIGRIEVDLERSNKQTTGNIKVPTALDQSETTLIAAAIETIERIGPSDAQIEVEKIEDVRGSKRDYIIERAKALMKDVEGVTDSREISGRVKDDSRTDAVTEYGKDKLPAGDLSDKEVIVVEGRADVLNLMKNRIKNVIAMNGTKLPETIKELSNEKDIILFVDGDRGGNLIAKNVVDNAKVKYIAMAPDGKEVEELNSKEILMQLRKKISPEEFFSKIEGKGRDSTSSKDYNLRESNEKDKEVRDLTNEKKEILKKISDKNNGSRKAILLNKDLNQIKSISARSLTGILRKSTDKPYAIVIDGAVTEPIIRASEEANVQVIAANNFSTTNTSIKLLSL